MNNGTLNCQESFMLALQTGLHKDLGTFHQIPPRDTERDLLTIRQRVQHEGAAFLTKTLPLLAKQLDQALLSGNFLIPSNFKTYKGSKLPRFMRRLFERVFDKEGILREDADVACIKDIRQVGYLFYKYQLPYPDRLVTKVIKEFIDDDKSIKSFDGNPSTQSNLYYATEVINEIFSDFSCDQVRPKNGPGSVANGLKPWQRYRPSRFYSNLDALVPYDHMFYYNDRHLFDRWSEYFNTPYDSDGMAHLLAVPKDSRGPRLISSEHSEFMVYQQSLRQSIVPWIEKHSLTGGQVNFTDQKVNGDLALRGSRDGRLATLDLSKASDLLSLDLVAAVFEDQKELCNYLLNSRSIGTVTPAGDLIFRKFAPMGSALCFPVQAIVFYSLLVGRMVANGERLSVAAKKVWVYGDDIIVPTHFVPEAMEVLESVGLKVNHDKSCYTGYFRESCGVDAYKGVDITPVKLKKVWNTRPDAQSIVAWVSMCNNLFAQGYWHVAEILQHKINRVIRHKLPLCTSDSPVVGYTTWSRDHAIEANKSRLRWNRRYQCWTLRARCASTKSKALLHDGWKRLLRYGWEKISGSSLPDTNPKPFDEAPFSSDAFTVRNTVQIKYSVVTEASM